MTITRQIETYWSLEQQFYVQARGPQSLNQKFPEGLLWKITLSEALHYQKEGNSNLLRQR
jgi:hypothetical protein